MGATLIGLMDMDNVLCYWITCSRARLPLLFLFFVSVGGLAYFGFIGLFLGPMLLAGIIAAFQIYEKEYRGEDKEALKANSHGPSDESRTCEMRIEDRRANRKCAE